MKQLNLVRFYYGFNIEANPHRNTLTHANKQPIDKIRVRVQTPELTPRDPPSPDPVT